ncbi:MAG: hypothetical protein GTO12_12035 [Proteobacteria bacterium]|nr:hypothetical protein [Pseudomonadota bacterium]
MKFGKMSSGCIITILVAQISPPQQSLDDGNGGKIFVYVETTQSTYTTPGKIEVNQYEKQSYVYTAPETNTYTYTKRYMFWINANGYVYRFEMND